MSRSKRATTSNGVQTPKENYEGSDLEALSTLKFYRNWIIGEFQPYIIGDAIEFGAGTGSMSSLMEPLVSTLDLVEPSTNLLKPLRDRFIHSDKVRIFDQSLEKHTLSIEDSAYDTVVLINVLEHIRDDESALENFLRILRPGGHLLLFVPALMSLFSRLDTIHGHFRRYHLPELRTAILNAGYCIVKSQYFDTFGILPWWFLNRVMGATSFNPKLAKLYDVVFAPPSKFIESRITPPIGKNILLIARRPS